MGRKTQRLRYDDEQGRDVVVKVRDDRSKARKVTNVRQLSLFANNNGAVSNELIQRNLVDYKPSGKIDVNANRVRAEASQIQKEIENQRFEGLEKLRDEHTQRAQRSDMTPAEVARRNRTDYSIRAQAILTASKAGDVKINRYQKGLLNKLASGDYEDAVYGKENKATGKRRYEQGTSKSQLKGRGRRLNDVERARAEERLQYLRPEGGRTGGRVTDSQFGSFLSNVRQRQQERQAQQTPAFNFADLPANFRDIDF